MVKPATLTEIRTAVINELVSITNALPTGTNSIGKISEITSPVSTTSEKVNSAINPYEDTSFIAGDSPRVLDVYTDLGNKASTKGYIIIDGAGDLLIEISHNGTSYNPQQTLKTGDGLDLTGITIKKLRLTHSGVDTAYRIGVMV